MGDSLALTLHEHHSRFAAPLGRVTRDEFVRELVVVIRCPQTHSVRKNQELQERTVDFRRVYAERLTEG
jgi:hypothetical protein